MLSNIVITLYGDRWLLDLPRWSFHNYEKVKVKVAQSYPTLCDPTDYTVHGTLQARILECGYSLSLLQGLVPTEGSIPGLLHCRRIFLPAEPQGKHKNTEVGSLSLLYRIFQPRNRTANTKSLHSIPECVFVYVCVYRKRQINLL